MPGTGHLKVAFATNDLSRVDADFMSAKELAFYDVSSTSAHFLEGIRFDEGAADQTPSPHDGLAARLAALRGCAILFMTKALNGEVGSAMIKNKIFAVKLDRPTGISDAIHQMQELMGAKPPRWLRKALGDERVSEDPAMGTV